MKKCIIIANGKCPKKSELKYFVEQGYSTIICADGGANSALKLKINPDYIIGDLDSIEGSTLKYFKGKSQIVQYKRQNDTDVEKCLKFAIKKKFTKAVLLGGTGNRLDHSICNLGIVLKFYDKIKISLLSDESFLVPVKGDFNFNSKKGELISIYGFDKKTTFTSTGLKYPLKNMSLPFGEKESTSNIAVKEKFGLKVNGGVGFVIRSFKMIKRNGHL